MNSHTFETYKIRSNLLKKIEIIINQINSQNFYYIQNLKDFIDYYINNNLCNITNNNLLNNIKQNMDRWNININNINININNDMSSFIYNYDSTDNEMNDFMNKFSEII